MTNKLISINHLLANMPADYILLCPINKYFDSINAKKDSNTIILVTFAPTFDYE